MINWSQGKERFQASWKKEYQTNLALILVNLFLNSFIVYDKGKGVYLWEKKISLYGISKITVGKL